MPSSQENRVPNRTTFGGKVAQGLLTVIAAGGVAFGTNLYFDTTLVTNPSIKIGTGSLIGSVAGQTATVCINTGGLAKYTACSFQNPSTGSAGILAVFLDMYKFSRATSATCTTSPDGTNTGKVIFVNRGVTGSGLTIGVTSGNLILPPSWYVRCWFSKTPNGDSSTKNLPIKAKLNATWRDQYVP